MYVQQHVQQHPTTLPRKLKMAPATLLIIADNTSTAFLASLLSASASLSKHFSKTPSSFDGVPPAKLSAPKASVTARTVVKIVIERAVRIENMVMPC